MAGSKLYLNKNVLEAAQERISLLFDHFTNIVISVSGGKDSTVLLDLALQEARRRGREIHAFFLDQEAEYQSTIDQIKHCLTLEGVKPYWFQVPLKMTNAASLRVDFLYAWGPEEQWMRDKDPMAIQSIDGGPERFYPFIEWWEKKFWNPEETAFLVGLRAEESLNRFRSVVKNPGWGGHSWTSGKKVHKAYPLYDWTFEDIWHHISINGLRYNQVYDFMHRKGHRIQDVRVSYLGHENSFKCLPDLHEFEPDTYSRLLERMPGVHVAARYAMEGEVFTASKLPEAFPTWRAYRDFLLETTPSAHVERFIKRFGGQPDEEYIYRQQVRQVLINDWESNIPITKRKSDPKEKLKKWMDIL